MAINRVLWTTAKFITNINIWIWVVTKEHFNAEEEEYWKLYEATLTNIGHCLQPFWNKLWMPKRAACNNKDIDRHLIQLCQFQDSRCRRHCSRRKATFTCCSTHDSQNFHTTDATILTVWYLITHTHTHLQEQNCTPTSITKYYKNNTECAT